MALLRELRHDPAVIRQDYQHRAVANAVVHGVREYGDNFALAVEPSGAGEYATGADFDSAAEEVVDWYARTDEEGNRVGYDYETGEYLEEPNDGPA